MNKRGSRSIKYTLDHLNICYNMHPLYSDLPLFRSAVRNNDLMKDQSSLESLMYQALGAEQIEPKHWILRTSLSKDELPALWIALGYDLICAGYMFGLTEYPARPMPFGLRIWGTEALDVVSAGSKWEKINLLPKPSPCPTIILAGLPGVGKSTIAREIRRIAIVPMGLTITTREQRAQDIEEGYSTQTPALDVERIRRSAAYAIPVRFRKEYYIFGFGTSILERFNSQNSLVVKIDSHFQRIDWQRVLMPDVRVVWLDLKESVRLQRLQSRITENAKVTQEYIDSCLKTKEFADLYINTDTLTPRAIAEAIVLWVRSRSNK